MSQLGQIGQNQLWLQSFCIFSNFQRAVPRQPCERSEGRGGRFLWFVPQNWWEAFPGPWRSHAAGPSYSIYGDVYPDYIYVAGLDYTD